MSESAILDAGASDLRAASDLANREVGVVCGFADACFAQRYMCMGVRVGSRVELVRRAPFGQACYLRVDGRHLAVRKEEAACLLLQRPTAPV